MISSDGIIIRIAVADISILRRPSKGVRVMRFKGDGDAKVLSIATAEHDEEEITDVPDAPDAEAVESAEEDAAELAAELEEEVIEDEETEETSNTDGSEDE